MYLLVCGSVKMGASVLTSVLSPHLPLTHTTHMQWPHLPVSLELTSSSSILLEVLAESQGNLILIPHELPR